jgi:hypothetical protein
MASKDAANHRRLRIRGKSMTEHRIDTVCQFYGNGVEYLAKADRVYSFPEYNFDIENLRVGAHGDYWITDEIAVCLGADVPRKRAVRLLRAVLKKIRAEIKKKERYR